MLFLILACFSLSWARSDRYYEIIKDMNQGINYYEFLGLSQSATPAEIKKSYRALLLKMHPDKNKEAGAVEQFLILQKSYEILTTEETKQEYDTFLRDGIPFQEQYYGRYMHEWGAPQHDPSTVLIWLIVITTIGKYLYQRYRHETMKELAATTDRYKTEMKRRKAAGILQLSFLLTMKDKTPTLKSRLRTFVNFVSMHISEFNNAGAEMPTWRDLFVVQLAYFLISIPVYAFKAIKFIPELMKRIANGELFHQPSQEELDETWRAKLGLSVEEFAEWKEDQIKKRAEFMQSGKMKKYKRWLRKNA